MVKLVWSRPCDGADGMAATADTLVLIGGEVLAAFDRATGDFRWEVITHDTSGAPVPLEAREDGLVVVEPCGEDTLAAFDLYTGEQRRVPDGFRFSEPSWTFDLPDGYTTDEGGLRYNEVTVWRSHERVSRVCAARVGGVTVVNDFDAVSVS